MKRLVWFDSKGNEVDPPKTNADRIRCMTTRGMVETLSDLYFKISGKQLNVGEQRELLRWLIKEVDDGS